jgi:hypothetical protein
MNRVLLLLNSSQQQESDLAQFLNEQQDRSSPHYHEWLTPQQFGERFGVSIEDIDVITKWLQGHGFRIDNVGIGGRTIQFSGTASQIESALHTELHHYDINGQRHTANASDISIPAALAPVVAGVAALSDFASKPMFNFGNGSHGISPNDFATIYDVIPLWNQGFDGTGQSIAIVARSNNDPNDIATFRSTFGLPPMNLRVWTGGSLGNDPGVVSGSDADEALMDVQWSGAVAKGATINLVVGGNTNSTPGEFLSAAYIVDQRVASVVGMSFGLCEADQGGWTFFRDTWSQAASEGMSVFVASGDSGSAGCDGSSASQATGGFGVNASASTPNNVAVGGTQFNENGTDSAYWQNSNNSNGSSAKGYVPEVAWNESGVESGGQGLWSTGGGSSILYGKPPWQTGFGIPAADLRYLPDVSLSAAGHDGYITKIIPGGFEVARGTSVSTQAFAGIMAIVNQVTNQASGNPNPRLYTLAAEVPSAFHDITAGSNAVPCASASPNCFGGIMAGYNAGPGYDLATGLGSVDAYVLAHAWAVQSGGGAAAPDFSISASPGSQTVLQGATASYTFTLTTSGGFNGTITLSASGLPQGVTATFNPPSIAASGTSTMTVTTTGTTSPGSYTLSITGTSGNVTHSAAVTLILNAAGTAQTTIVECSAFNIDAGTIAEVTQGTDKGCAGVTPAFYFADETAAGGGYYYAWGNSATGTITFTVNTTAASVTQLSLALRVYGHTAAGSATVYALSTANQWVQVGTITSAQVPDWMFGIINISLSPVSTFLPTAPGTYAVKTRIVTTSGIGELDVDRAYLNVSSGSSVNSNILECNDFNIDAGTIAEVTQGTDKGCTGVTPAFYFADETAAGGGYYYAWGNSATGTITFTVNTTAASVTQLSLALRVYGHTAAGSATVYALSTANQWVQVGTITSAQVPDWMFGIINISLSPVSTFLPTAPGTYAVKTRIVTTSGIGELDVDRAYLNVSSGGAGSNYDQVLLTEPSLVRFWRMSASGSTEPDLTGSGNTGRYESGPLAVTTMPNGDAAAVFNGSNQDLYVTSPSDKSLSITTTGYLTWEAWIRPDVLEFPVHSRDGYVSWMGKCEAPGSESTCEWEARMYDTTTYDPSGPRPNRLSGYVFNLDGHYGAAADWQPSFACCYSQNVIQAGHWYHVVVQYSLSSTPACPSSTYPGSIDIWVNGLKWDQSSHAPTGCMSQFNGITPQPATSQFLVGTMDKTTWFLGAIAKVAIYNKPLTQTQINNHYQAMTGQQPPQGSCGNTCSFF